MTTGAGRQLAAQHSHSLEGWYAHVPGLTVVAPATLEDARGMLWSAIEDPDPVIIVEHGGRYGVQGELADDAAAVPLTGDAVRRTGSDVTVIASGGTVPKALAAGEELARLGIAAEVIDLRALRPLDTATILCSVAGTHHAVVVDEGWRTGGLSAELAATIAEGAFHDLDAAVARVCSAEVPIPYAAHLEQHALPQVGDIVRAAQRVLGY